MRFVQIIEKTYEGQTRNVFIDPGEVCLIQQAIEMTPIGINTIVNLKNGEFVQTEEHYHSILSRLGITT